MMSISGSGGRSELDTASRVVAQMPTSGMVRLGNRVTQSRLPLFPQQQTFLSPAMTSEKCQKRK
jgi:hypothetical protein